MIIRLAVYFDAALSLDTLKIYTSTGSTFGSRIYFTFPTFFLYLFVKVLFNLVSSCEIAASLISRRCSYLTSINVSFRHLYCAGEYRCHQIL